MELRRVPLILERGRRSAPAGAGIPSQLVTGLMVTEPEGLSTSLIASRGLYVGSDQVYQGIGDQEGQSMIHTLGLIDCPAKLTVTVKGMAEKEESKDIEIEIHHMDIANDPGGLFGALQHPTYVSSISQGESVDERTS